MEASPPTQPPAPVQPETTDDLLRQVLAEQQQHRAEVAALREQIDAQKPPPPAAPQTPRSPEEALKARMDEINQHDFYCPGCGLLYDYRQKCSGKPESPHPPIEVVLTDELKSGDPSKHTLAPVAA